MMANLKHRDVTASFIVRFHDETGDLSSEFRGQKDESIVSTPYIALFKRSGEVRTYQHKYAPISGSIESTDASPLVAAIREIKEETTLSYPKDVSLLYQGKPYSFEDITAGRSWTIHPFSFVLRSARQVPYPDEQLARNTSVAGAAQHDSALADPASQDPRIKIDWEHSSYLFLKHTELNSSTLPSVPRLLDSLRRVWPDLDLGSTVGPILRKGLWVLKSDHESGARQLTLSAVRIFISVLQNMSGNDLSGLVMADEPGSATAAKETWWRQIRSVAWHIWKNGRESMGAGILNAMLHCLAIVEHHWTSADQITPSLINGITKEIQDYTRTREESTSELETSFASFIDDHYPSTSLQPITILTLSASSTIAVCLIGLITSNSIATEPRSIDIRILESRPLYEGVNTANRLLLSLQSLSCSSSTQDLVTLTVYTDASAAIAARIDPKTVLIPSSRSGGNAQTPLPPLLLLLGADLIASTGAVSNKTGSLPAVLSARHVTPGVKVAVLAETEKILPFDPPNHDEENDPNEVIAGWENHGPGSGTTLGRALRARSGNDENGGKCSVKNIYFEWVDAELVDDYITEDGLLTREEIGKRAEEGRKRANAFFSGI